MTVDEIIESMLASVPNEYDTSVNRPPKVRPKI